MIGFHSIVIALIFHQDIENIVMVGGVGQSTPAMNLFTGIAILVLCAEYEYCYSCEKVHSWRALTDTADHYYILNVLMEYQGDHDAVKAYHALSKRGVNIRETDGLLPSVKMLMVEIASKVRSEERRVGKECG